MAHLVGTICFLSNLEIVFLHLMINACLTLESHPVISISACTNSKCEKSDSNGDMNKNPNQTLR